MLPIKVIAACLLFAAYVLFAAGCVTVGYDFLKQQATVTMSPSTKGFKK
jgi:hypothetical protein